MREHVSRAGSARLSLLLMGALLLVASMAMATIEPPDPGTPCLDITMECIDATTPGGAIEIYGTVTNCGDIPFDGVYVYSYSDFELIASFPLDAGESVSWSSSYVPDPDDCPSTSMIKVKAYYNNWAAKIAYLYEDATCECGPTLKAICLTPGFWGNRAGTEKKNSQNITQAVMDAAGGLFVCGQLVDNTSLEVYGSAIEGMCVSPRGAQVLQLARTLVATSLNCVMSGAGAGCDGMSIAELYNRCNDECVWNSDPDAVEACNTELDCWNNGGTMFEDGMCQLGTCAYNDARCEDEDDCAFDDAGLPVECVPLGDTCHDQLLVNEELGLFFEDPGPAGSSKACNDAIGNDCTLFDCD